MNVLVIGQGGREHAIVKSLNLSPKVKTIYCAPGNGGIASDAVCLQADETDFAGLVKIVEDKGIDLTIVGPEKPLVEGIVDYFQERNLAIVGPTKEAARIEGNKSYAKELMRKYDIPTADHQVFSYKDEAIAYVKEKGIPIVIKADGLAAGKGVTVAYSIDEALAAIDDIMDKKIFGESGNKVVIEEFLTGEELTVMAFVNGSVVLPMEPAQDHKPVYDGDKGPNTGGMGSYSPVPHIEKTVLDEIYNKVLLPAAKAMVNEGYPFQGILYAGMMLTDNGPKVIEFNARFGDPETQVVLPRLKTDIVEVFQAIADNSLGKIQLEWKDQAAVCVIMASGGYPKEYKKGLPIKIEQLPQDTNLYIAGATKTDNQLFTSGGRVLGVTGLADDIIEAQKKAYQGMEKISFEGAHYRTDIANKAIKQN